MMRVAATGSGLLTAFQNGVTICLNVNCYIIMFEVVFVVLTTPNSTPTPSFAWYLPGGSLTLNIDIGNVGVLYIGSTSPTVDGDNASFGIPAPSYDVESNMNIVYSLYSFSGGRTGTIIQPFANQEGVPYVFIDMNLISNGGILTATQGVVTASIGLTINAQYQLVLTMF